MVSDMEIVGLTSSFTAVVTVQEAQFLLHKSWTFFRWNIQSYRELTSMQMGLSYPNLIPDERQSLICRTEPATLGSRTLFPARWPNPSMRCILTCSIIDIVDIGSIVQRLLECRRL